MISKVLPVGITAVDSRGDLPDASLLPEEAAALGRVSEKRRREFTIARSCARRALAQIGFPPMPILPGPHRQPLWPLDAVGSITHCDGYCAAAVALRARFATIGIDAEVHDELPTGVLELITLDEERGSLKALARDGICYDRILFSAKESIYKACFQIAEEWLEFKRIIVDIDPESQTFDARILGSNAFLNGHAMTRLNGNYLVEENWVVTAVSVASSSTLAENSQN